VSVVCVSVVRLIVATRRSGPQASQPIQEMPGSVASGTSYIISYDIMQILCKFPCPETEYSNHIYTNG